MIQTEGTEESNGTNAPRGPLSMDERSYFHIITVCRATELKQRRSHLAPFHVFCWALQNQVKAARKLQRCFMNNSWGAVQEHELLRQHEDSTVASSDSEAASLYRSRVHSGMLLNFLKSCSTFPAATFVHRC